MRKLALLFLTAFMLGLVSCGGSEQKEEAQSEAQAVEQKAEEVKQEAQQEAQQSEAAGEEKAEEAPAGEAQASGKDGAALFADNGCTACHKEQEKNIGPSLKEMAKVYEGKEDQMIKFLKGEAEAIVDPAQFAIMQPNLEITKKMNDADLKALVDYMMSIK